MPNRHNRDTEDDSMSGNPCKHKSNPGKHRKHTPIVSEKQRGLFGAELARRRAGKASRMKGITTKELEEHLRESKGKNLPTKIKRKKKHNPNRLASHGIPK